MDDIQVLISKYENKVKELETQLLDARNKLAALTEVSQIMKEEGISPKQTSLFNRNTVTVSNKYAGKSMSEAILDMLTVHSELDGKEVLTQLLQNGFKSSSKSLKTDTYKRLNVLVKANKVTAIKNGKELTKYRITSAPSTP